MNLPLQCPQCRAPLPLAAYGADELVACPTCASPVRALVFPAFLTNLQTAKAEAVLDESEASCFYHPGKKAAVACESCGRFICSLCEIELEGQHLCPQCLEGGKRKGKLASLETSRTRYDNIALLLVGFPLVFGVTVGFTIFTAPVALFVCLRYRKAPRSLVRPGHWRWWATLLLSLLEITAWVLLIVVAVNAPANHKHHKTASPASIHSKR